MDLKNMIPSKSEIAKTHLVHKEIKEKLRSERVRSTIKQAFDKWHDSKSDNSKIFIRDILPFTVERELKSIGYKISRGVDGFMISW